MSCFEERRRVLAGAAGASDEGVSALFWKTETRLRTMFDAYGSDALSAGIIRRYPYQDLIRKRRENYRYILAQNPFNPQAVPVFPELPEEVCPSHLALYAADRERALAVLAAHGVKAAVYWPFHGELNLEDFPGAARIYPHIYSVPIDQRCSRQDMDIVAGALYAAGAQ
jgi:hypothetical protein